MTYITEIRIPDLGQSTAPMGLWLDQQGLIPHQDWHWLLDRHNDQIVFQFHDARVATMFSLRWS